MIKQFFLIFTFLIPGVFFGFAGFADGVDFVGYNTHLCRVSLLHRAKTCD
jgi:hypothetical protein